MELRIVELAHKRGLTMSDIARYIGISRVNLSNSLNGNPTLSRLKEVAQILHVDVSELFKPSSQGCVTGYIEFNNKIVKIENLSGLKSVITEADPEASSLMLSRETMDYILTMKKAFEKCYGKPFSMDEFLVQMSASVEEGDCGVWEEFCIMRNNR